MRVIFGDRAKYLDKFKTCARVRPLNEQRLTTEFFIKEHCKPLFNSHGFLNLKGAGGLHQDFLEIDFLVVSDRGE